MLTQLCAYYDDYEKILLKRYENISPLAGVLGMGNHPKDDPCNTVFYENVENWVKEFMAGSPSQEAVEEVAEWILKLAKAHREEKTYWICYALQGQAKGLIPMISQAKAQELLTWFEDAYPAKEWLPVQEEIYKALKKQSGKSVPQKRGLFRRG